MKKSTFTIILLLATYFLIAQVYLPPQDFSGTEFPPEGWTIENGGDENTFEPGPMPATTEPSCAWVETSANMEIDDRIISPSIELPVGSEAKIYAQLRGSVGYAIAQYWDPDNEVRYFIEVSTDGGASWTAVLDLDDPASVQAAGSSFPWDDWNWFDVAIDVSDYAGQTVMIAFHHEKEFVPTAGGSFGVTNFGIWEDVQNDAQLLELNLPDYAIVNSDVEIGGVIKNIGSNEIISFEAEVLINDELVTIFEKSGISISAFGSMNFTVDSPLSFDNMEYYNVELNITMVNGVLSNSPENNFLTQQISIASETVSRKPLFEMFTSSTCGPCVGGNETLDGVLQNNLDSTYSLVKSQMDWPGNGDPYYIEDGGIRKDYYNVSAVPSFFINGKGNSSYDFTQTKFNQAKDEPCYVEMSLDHSYMGLNVSAYVSINPKLNIENISVHMTIVEKTTYNNTGSNGETEFHNVLMAMMPDGNGTSASLTDGETANFTASTNLITTFIEEFDDLWLVVWVQDNLTKSVLQSESHYLYVYENIIDNQNNKIALYPNPTKGIFTINGVSDCTVSIIDISGREVFREDVGKSNAVIDISDFNKGVYFVKIVKVNEEVYNQKIILN